MDKVQMKCKFMYLKQYAPTKYKSKVAVIITVTNSNIYKYFIIVRLGLGSSGMLCSDYTEY